MGKLIVLAPLAASDIAASRGTGVANLLTADPKEAWVDTAVGTAAQINIDFGAARDVDTVFLGFVQPAHAAATWTIRGGLAGYADQVVKPAGALRAVDSASSVPELSHALWYGVPVSIRYLRIEITQPAGQPVLSAGRVMAGSAFEAEFGKGWGAGRKVVDTGTATPLPGGGFATVEGMRKGSYSWSFGDLTPAEVDQLYEIQLQCGETAPVLVVEDPDATTGQIHRIHHGKFTSLKQYDRRNPAQVRWEMSIEDWV